MSGNSNTDFKALISKMELYLKDQDDVELTNEEQKLLKNLLKFLVAITRLGRIGVTTLLIIVIIISNLESLMENIQNLFSGGK